MDLGMQRLDAPVHDFGKSRHRGDVGDGEVGDGCSAKLCKAGDGKITVTFKGNDQKHTHDVAKDAKITLDEKKAKLEELKEGFHADVTMDDKFVVTKIEAHSKKK